jgi:hypothetical protein
MADDTAANLIVGNYRQFYQLYIRFLDSTLTGADSAQIEVLALLCPVNNGGAVYKARALYDMINDTLRLFPDNCDSIAFDSSYMMRKGNTTNSIKNGNKNTGKQKYTLLPNPNDGSFVLKQSILDEQPVKIEIWDAVGRIVYKGQLLFTDATAQVRMGSSQTVAGLYLLQVTDSVGQQYRIKYVVR